MPRLERVTQSTRGDVLPGDDDSEHSATIEAALIRRAQAGDMESFDRLLAPLLPRALLLARRLLRHREDAEDLVQDAALRALERIDQCDRGRAFGPWFLRLLVNLGLNQVQAIRLRRHEPLADMTETRLPAPDAALRNRDITERFAAAVAKLPARQRQIVMLHEVEGWPAVSIAKTLDLSPQTVRWHLHTARATLRFSLASLWDDTRASSQEAG